MRAHSCMSECGGACDVSECIAVLYVFKQSFHLMTYVARSYFNDKTEINVNMFFSFQDCNVTT